MATQTQTHDSINSSDYLTTEKRVGSTQIERIETAELFNETPKQHEKLYLAPDHPVAGELRRTFGNPTPVALCGFLLANTPASIELMGWRGAGAGAGNTSAGTGSYYFFGGMLLLLGGIGEWVLGNTFPSVVFLSFSGFWFTFGSTLTPYYAAVSSYGKDTAAFYDSFAFFLVFMGLLCLMYMVCALRTNICLVVILLLFVIAFGFLSASYWYSAAGHVSYGHSMLVGEGACAFAASMIAWYLWFTMLLEAVDFPFKLPVGDLSQYIKGEHETRIAVRRASLAQVV